MNISLRKKLAQNFLNKLDKKKTFKLSFKDSENDSTGIDRNIAKEVLPEIGPYDKRENYKQFYNLKKQILH